QRVRDEYRARCEELWEGLDLLLLPTVEFVAPPADLDERELRGRAIRLTYSFDALGWPVLALPCGEAEDGLPASVQLAGRRGDDEGDVRWILDPVDGTKNFSRGIPVWATLVALEREGEVVCGVVSAPALGHRWWAARGEGAWRDGEGIHVSAVAALDEAAVSC